MHIFNPCPKIGDKLCKLELMFGMNCVFCMQNSIFGNVESSFLEQLPGEKCTAMQWERASVTAVNKAKPMFFSRI
jgi:hypothetical protein